MSRLPSPPPLPSLLPLLLLSLLVYCLQQTGNCGAAAAVTVENTGYPVTGGVLSEDDGTRVSVRGSSAECGAGQYSLLGRCHRQRGAGTLCLADSWCRSGRCRLGLCRRSTRRTKNGTLALGAACSLDRECAYGTCSAEGDSAGTCGCPADFTACDGHCCSAPTDVEASPACPYGFTECGNYCYHAVAAQYNYTEAEQYCSGVGAILATPRTAGENACAWHVAYAAADDNNFWLGYRNNTVDSFAGADEQGDMTYNNWARDEPNLMYNHDFGVLLNIDRGNWYSMPSFKTRYPVCQAQN